MPFLMYCGIEVWHCAGTGMAVSNTAFHETPYSFNWIHIRRAGGPGKKVCCHSKLLKYLFSMF